MNIVFFLIVLLLLLSIVLVAFWFWKRIAGKYKVIIIVIPLVVVLAYGGTYIPHKVVSIDPADVSKIYIFDGNTGYDFEITDKDDIDHIINNLNEITFQKGKLAFMYMGFSFNTTIYEKKGKVIKELTINSNDTIRYNGFFYTSTDKPIDYDYIAQLVRK